MDTPESIILDASVVVKWFVDEEYTDKAIAMPDDYEKGDCDLFGSIYAVRSYQRVLLQPLN